MKRIFKGKIDLKKFQSLFQNKTFKMRSLKAVLIAALLLLQCGDIEMNPGPRKSVSGKAPSADDKINGLASTLSDYEAKIQGNLDFNYRQIHHTSSNIFEINLGLAINDVMVLRGRGPRILWQQYLGLCNKMHTEGGGGGFKNCPKFRDVYCGRRRFLKTL